MPKNNMYLELNGIQAKMLKNADEDVIVKEIRKVCNVVQRKEKVPEDSWKIELYNSED